MPDSVTVQSQARLSALRLTGLKQKNAINLEMVLAIESALRRLEEDAALQVGVLSGTSSVFSAGMDLKRFARGEKPILPESGSRALPARNIPSL